MIIFGKELNRTSRKRRLNQLKNFKSSVNKWISSLDIAEERSRELEYKNEETRHYKVQKGKGEQKREKKKNF